MKKRITGLFAATLLALSMMAVPAMADTPAGDCDGLVTHVDEKTPELNRDLSKYC